MEVVYVLGDKKSVCFFIGGNEVLDGVMPFVRTRSFQEIHKIIMPLPSNRWILFEHPHG